MSTSPARDHQAAPPETPAYVFDEQVILDDAAIARAALREENVRLLFAMKSFSCQHGLAMLATVVDGFHASSLFEAKLARKILGPDKTIHVTTPGLVPHDFDELCALSDIVSFNSLTQWDTFGARAKGRVRCGLRINPRLSLLADERYDPCRRHSKLGASIDSISDLATSTPERFEGLDGILIHSNCDSLDFRKLLKTVEHLDARLSVLLSRLKWINLGGGYLFKEQSQLQPLRNAIQLLQSRYDLEVFIEPGASIIRRGGSLVTTVLDLFESDGKQIAILDSTVNHVPETFEFLAEPDVAGHLPGSDHEYILAGATCLAGDIFGEYAFAAPLAIGSRVTLENIGAYSMVKAHMFNGVNLPAVYSRTASGEYVLQKRFTYQDFEARCGGA